MSTIFDSYTPRVTELTMDRGTIPPRILASKTVDASLVFTAMVSIGLSIHPYFLPFYFQSAKGLSAEASGLRTIPYLFSITIAAIAVGSLVAVLGKYHPFLWSGAVIYTIGSGLLYTLHVNSSAGKWIGYQILAGAGIGSTQQLSAIAIQAALPAEDMPVGNALIVFFQNLAGSIAVSTAENLFTHTLKRRLVKNVSQINAQQVITAGATNIKSVVPAALLKPVQGAYSFAVARAFILPIAAGGIAFLSVSLIDHKSVGDNKRDTK